MRIKRWHVLIAVLISTILLGAFGWQGLVWRPRPFFGEADERWATRTKLAYIADVLAKVNQTADEEDRASIRKVRNLADLRRIAEAKIATGHMRGQLPEAKDWFEDGCDTPFRCEVSMEEKSMHIRISSKCGGHETYIEMISEDAGGRIRVSWFEAD